MFQVIASIYVEEETRSFTFWVCKLKIQNFKKNETKAMMLPVWIFTDSSHLENILKMQI